MNWNFIKSLLEDPDEKLTEIGLQLKRLAERMQNNDYEVTEEDKEIIDQKWRRIWKD
tara:strand:- start:112 stop:282 length:171 start_codon:yes stop_codon:yes gene_type:complete